MTNTDAGGGDRLALAVLAQYRMGTTGQLHRVLAPGVRIEQTRRRLGKLRTEGLVDRVTLPQAGRTRAWFPTEYGVRVAMEWPKLRERRPPRLVGVRSGGRAAAGRAHPGGDRDRARLPRRRPAPRRDVPAAGLGTRSAPPDRQRRGGHPDALLYYRSSDALLRAFVEVDRATMGPERLAAKLTAYARLHRHIPTPPPDAATSPPRTRKRHGGSGIRSSRESCSSWTAPAP